jgi:hypothetical protein
VTDVSVQGPRSFWDVVGLCLGKPWVSVLRRFWARTLFWHGSNHAALSWLDSFGAAPGFGQLFERTTKSAFLRIQKSLLTIHEDCRDGMSDFKRLRRTQLRDLDDMWSISQGKTVS